MSTVPSNLVPTPISQLPTIPTNPTTADQLMVVQNGNTYRATLGSLVNVVTVPSSRAINTGTGLAGGGTLATDLTLYLANTGVAAGTYGAANTIPVLSVNAQGQLTSVSTAAISVAFNDITGKPTTLAGYGITDAQPLNNNLTALAGVGTDGLLVKTGSGSATSRSIAAGTGITVTNGDGISGDPTVAITNTAVTPGTYGQTDQIPVLTINQQGQITSAGEITTSVDWGNVNNTPTTLAGYGITDAVPDTRTVEGVYSLIGGGPLSGNVQISLDNDMMTPGNDKYYGTDNLGNRGWYTLTGGGSVSYVGLSMPSEFAVTGSPITTTGTFSVTYAPQASHKFFAGPTSGSSTTPTFRSIVADDLPITSVSANSYGSANNVATFTVDAQGRLTAAANANIDGINLTTGTISTAPSGNTDIANKAYVDSVAQGLNVKQSVLYGTIGNITLSGLGIQANGEWTGALTAGDRILVKSQSTAANNGIYAANSGSWTRTSDASTWDELVSAFVFVQDGATLADTGWVCTANPGGTLGVTAINWAQFSGAGTYTAGTGLTLSGNQFSITNTAVTAASYGSASSVATFTVNAQGQLTLAGNSAIAINANQITSGTISSSLLTGSYTGITGVGTLTAGTWNATTIAVAYGGTGATTASGALTNLGAAASGANSDITSMSGLTGGIASPTYFDMGNGNAVTLAAGRMWYTPNTGAWNLGMGGGNITQQVGEELFVYGKASSAVSNTNLQIVYQTGTVGASGVVTFAPTIASITDGNLILGVATESILLNGFGRITAFGIVHGINTTGSAYGETWADGDTIWYNPVTGNPTKTKPSAPNIKVQVGTVINAGSGGSGSFAVEINHGSVLGGTDSNVQITSPANNNLLQYDSTAGYWKNVAASSVSVGSATTATTATNLAAGVANQIPYQTGAGATSYIVAPSVANTYLNWSGSAFQWLDNPLGTVTSVDVSGGTTGLTFSGGPVTSSGTITMAGTLAVANGGTGATTVAAAQTNLQVDPAGTAVAMAIALG